MDDLTPLEILEKIDLFYNNAWSKIVIFISIIIAIIGVAYPLIISYYQNKRLKIKEEKIKNELNALFQKKIEEVKKELFESIEEKLNSTIDDFSKKQDILKAKVNGALFHLQSNSTKSLKGKVLSLIRSARWYMRGKDDGNLHTILKGLNNMSPKFTKDLLQELEIEDASIDELFDDLRKYNNKVLNKEVKKLKLAVEKLRNEANEKQA